MSRKHKHGKHNRQIARQQQQEVVDERLGVLLDWYLEKIKYYERQGDKYARLHNERLLEAAAGKWMLFKFKAEKLVASL